MLIKNLPYCIQQHLQKPEYVAISNKGVNDLGSLFTWSRSPISGEGGAFWKKINDGDYKEFFQKYRGDIISDFQEAVQYKDEKVGTKYILTENRREFGLEVGDIVILEYNDGTLMPRFKTAGFIHWTRLVYKNPNKLLVMNNMFKDDGGFKERHNAKVGDKFKVVSFKRIDSLATDATSYFESIGLKLGDIVTFHIEDGSDAPKFRLSNGNQKYINWGCLAPVDSKSDIEKPSAPYFTNAPQPNEIIGTKYECIGEEKPYYQIGDIVEYKRNDDSLPPLFYNPRNNKDVYIPWVKLKRINSNLNNKEDVKVEHTSSTSCELLCSASIAISIGSFNGGSSICCATEEIRMGS